LVGCADEAARVAETERRNELPAAMLSEGGVLPDGGRVFPSGSPGAREVQKWMDQGVGETITLRTKDGIVVEVTKVR